MADTFGYDPLKSSLKMPRAELRNLYHDLRTSQFMFMERGEHHIKSIYKSTKSEYASYCDDSFLCHMNCRSGHKQPEWMHAVRRALQSLKSQTDKVAKGERQGYWVFK